MREYSIAHHVHDVGDARHADRFPQILLKRLADVLVQRDEGRRAGRNAAERLPADEGKRTRQPGWDVVIRTSTMRGFQIV